MPDAENWLVEYGNRHRDLDYPGIYWLSVLLTVTAIVGLLSLLPVPGAFMRISPVLNWATAFLMATVVYYFIISISLAIGMLPFVFGLTALQIWLAGSSLPVGRFAAGLLFAGIAGLFVGRGVRSEIRPVLADLQTTMIAPIWMLSRFYRRVGIPF